jgi:hypothetical protein
MKKIFFVFLLLPVFASQNVNAQGWEWARSSGGGGLNEGDYCATDAEGSVYIAGTNGYFITFNTDTLANKGAFIAKYNSLGDLKWATSFYTSAGLASMFGAPLVNGLVTDSFGNEYLLGAYEATVLFGNDSLTTPGTGHNYCFISKIDSQGNVKWVKSIGNVIPGFGGGGYYITTDLQGNIYVSFAFLDSATIGGFAIPSVGGGHILVAKYDSSGIVFI